MSTYKIAMPSGIADSNESSGGVCTRLAASDRWCLQAMLQRPGSRRKVIRRFVLRCVARARQEMTEQAQCYLNRLGDRDKTRRCSGNDGLLLTTVRKPAPRCVADAGAARVRLIVRLSTYLAEG